MGESWLRRAAVASVGAVLTLEVAAVAMAVGHDHLPEAVVYLVYAGVQVAAGALVVLRYPRHPIGWLLVGFALLNAASDFCLSYGSRAAEASWPLGTTAELVGMLAWIPAAAGLILLFLLFPDGHPPGRRWRVVPWIWAAGALLAVPGWALNPRLDAEFAAGTNPFAVDAFPAELFFAVGAGLVSVSLVLAVAALVVRLRRSTGIERQQVTWVAFAAVVLAVVLPASAALWTVWEPIRLVAAVSLALLPVAASVAILRHHLYDVDVVIARTAAFAAGTAVVAGSYAAVVLAVGTVVDSTTTAALAAVVVAAEIAVLQVRLRRRVRELDASRRRIAATAEEERQRIARDLHDGAQQRLVSIGLMLRHAQHGLGQSGERSDVDATLDRAVEEVGRSIDELRSLAGGLRPSLLEAGLGPALDDVASRAPVPTRVDVVGERPAPDVEAAAYFIAAEALTNAIKHASASVVTVRVHRDGGELVVVVEDDGRGGARPDGGSGLLGLADRVRARRGTFELVSPVGCGTRVEARLPCG